MSRNNNLQRSIHARMLTRARLSMIARIVVAAVAAFIASSAWYMVFGVAVMKLRGVEPDAASAMSVPASLMLAELARNLIVATMLAHLAAALKIIDLRGAARLGFLLWFGFPAMILTGSVMWENVPWMLAAIHAGDWLIKLPLIAAILSIGLRRTESCATEQPATAALNQGRSQ